MDNFNIYLFSDGSVVKNLPANSRGAWDVDCDPGLGRSPEEGNGNPVQCSSLENPHGQRSLEGYSLWGHEELVLTEWVNTAQQVRIMDQKADCAYSVFDFILWSCSHSRVPINQSINSSIKMKIKTEKIQIWKERLIHEDKQDLIFFFALSIFFPFIFISWRLITLENDEDISCNAQ